MVATRGKPDEGAERELRELIQLIDKEKVVDDCANKGIKWNWNPPLGSHFRGVSESLIKVAKKSL